MVRITVVIPLFLIGCCSSAAVDAEGNRPVSKVITLLKDMVTQLQKEGEDDAAVKEQMDCWCETGLRDKTAANEANTVKIGRLTEEIASLATNSARLNTEIETLSKEIAHNTEALEEATSLRQKQLAEFTEDEKSMMASIAQMAGAVKTIAAKHDGSFDKASEFKRTGSRSAAFLQADVVSPRAREIDMLEVIVAVKTQMRRHHDLINSHQRSVVTAFLDAPEDTQASFLQEGAEFSPDHSSASGGILGVLKGMKESFETNLAASQKEETRDQADYEALKSAKSTEIAAGESLVETKTMERADTDQRHAEAEQDLQDTERTLAADQDYLKNLKQQCANVDAEFAERTKTRQLEIQAVSKANAFLNSDDANDLYARTFGGAASFVQTEMHLSTRSAASQVLFAVAKLTHDPRLSTLAVRVMSPQDAFNQVRKSIQDMIDTLVAEKEEEIKHKDFCVEELNQNMRDTDDKNRIKQNAESKIEELTMTIKTLTKEIAELKAEISSTYVAIKRGGEDRQKQNSEFQRMVADQRATQKLLVGALDILKGFYGKTSLVQAHGSSSDKAPAGAPPPPGFKSYENNAQSGGVMGMIKQIIEDAKAMEADALKGEEEAQVGYETFITEANKSIVNMQKQISNKMEDRALAESEKAQKVIELKTVNVELDELKKANDDLHGQCDYTIKNFDKKQGARDDEIMALKESMSIFSGGSFGAFVQALKH